MVSLYINETVATNKNMYFYWTKKNHQQVKQPSWLEHQHRNSGPNQIHSAEIKTRETIWYMTDYFDNNIKEKYTDNPQKGTTNPTLKTWVISKDWNLSFSFLASSNHLEIPWFFTFHKPCTCCIQYICLQTCRKYNNGRLGQDNLIT